MRARAGRSAASKLATMSRRSTRLRFVRWLTKAEAGIALPSYERDQTVEPGPPTDEPKVQDPPRYADRHTTPDPELQDAPDKAHDPQTHPVPSEEDIDRRAARRLQTEKLFEATKAFAKTIV